MGDLCEGKSGTDWRGKKGLEATPMTLQKSQKMWGSRKQQYLSVKWASKKLG